MESPDHAAPYVRARASASLRDIVAQQERGATSSVAEEGTAESALSSRASVVVVIDSSCVILQVPQ